MMVAAFVARHDLDEGLAQRLAGTGRISCDIETSGLNPRSDRIGTVQVHASGVGSAIIQVGNDRPTRLCRLIENDRVLTVFHHAMFDLRFMSAHWGVVPRNVACTKIASKLLAPRAANEEHSLQYLVQSRLGVPLSKAQRRSDWLADELTPDQLRYATADVEYLLPLLGSLEADLRLAHLYELYMDCLSFIPSRVVLELGGWPDVFSY